MSCQFVIIVKKIVGVAQLLLDQEFTSDQYFDLDNLKYFIQLYQCVHLCIKHWYLWQSQQILTISTVYNFRNILEQSQLQSSQPSGRLQASQNNLYSTMSIYVQFYLAFGDQHFIHHL
ncbi:Hypothetical_protein [Hexamita inflata]|uniref:Hypothetical_protein n=1 Tax=Hexamita inflata TaxID=28002 RepID=A0AA86PUC1_9EUKA|nr:Hypothetical protein HINF_LOCUS33666 [Hexamita inflata]